MLLDCAHAVQTSRPLHLFVWIQLKVSELSCYGVYFRKEYILKRGGEMLKDRGSCRRGFLRQNASAAVVGRSYLRIFTERTSPLSEQVDRYFSNKSIFSNCTSLGRRRTLGNSLAVLSSYLGFDANCSALVTERVGTFMVGEDVVAVLLDVVGNSELQDLLNTSEVNSLDDIDSGSRSGGVNSRFILARVRLGVADVIGAVPSVLERALTATRCLPLATGGEGGWKEGNFSEDFFRFFVCCPAVCSETSLWRPTVF